MQTYSVVDDVVNGLLVVAACAACSVFEGPLFRRCVARLDRVCFVSVMLRSDLTLLVYLSSKLLSSTLTTLICYEVTGTTYLR